MKRKSIALVLSLGLLGSVTLGSIETVYAEGNKNTTNISEVKVDNKVELSDKKNKEIKNGWEIINDKWYYHESDGSLATGFKKINDEWYRFDNNGEMQVGWQYINDIWYHFRDNGPMDTGWRKINNDWYYFNNDGEMQTGWQSIGNKRYHFRDNGVMDTGWRSLGSDWYLLNSDGEMQTGWQHINNIWYHLEDDGKMNTGWQDINGDKYYFNNSGEMQTGWQYINDIWYHLRENGPADTGWRKINNDWYYFDNIGKMQTSWQDIDNSTYYFNDNGVMSIGWRTIESEWYYFNNSGEKESNKVIDDWYLDKNGVGNQIVTEGAYGKSGNGRDLEYYRIGHGKKVLFSVFGVHGYEDAWSGDSQELKIIAEKSVNRLRSEYNTKGIDLSEWSVYIIPSANPDGRIDGWTNNGPGRTTVTTKNDINRSFPTGFSPFYSARNYTGPTALGSPEAKALYSFINKTMEGATEKVLLDVHGWENKTIGNPSIARYFDNEFGFRNINKYPGGFVITYGNAIGAKSVLVEFPVPYSHQDILRRDFSGKFANGLVNILLNN
ncbi:cell wall-binding protein [Clostridium perfringens]|uniref:cell wall-binding protein n=1 Tax=Clostridium perfringens TaxID=1502 RepID=UPI0013E382E7|nr:cell wall-binding protein [Clostridium perfringens]NGT73286.1 cell wall-binding protein [Clostridium perfringens]NGU21833.1 cell wall-binding protein [Clostridium perfringens]